MNALKKFLYEKDPLGTAATIEVTRADLEELLGLVDRCEECEDCCG